MNLDGGKWKNRFHFGYSGHDPLLEKRANLDLIQLLALAPPSSEGRGEVTLKGQDFSAAISICSPFRAFFATGRGPVANIAIARAFERIEDELFRWRWGGGPGNFGQRAGVPAGGLPWAQSG